jgi:hypothetical protein
MVKFSQIVRVNGIEDTVLNRHFWLRMVVTLVGLVMLVGCRESQRAATGNDEAPLDVGIAFESATQTVGRDALLVTVTEVDGRPVRGAQVRAVGNMNHAGMTPSQGEASEEIEPGVYRILIAWTMGGDWYVDVQVTALDGRTTTRTAEFTVGDE